MKVKRAIVDLIPFGEENAISMCDLARALDVTPRTVRRRVHEARKGAIICENEYGYFTPASIDELRDYIHRGQARVMSGVAGLTYAVNVLNAMEVEDDG